MSADPLRNVTPHEEPQLATLPAPAGPADRGYAFWTAERACCCPAKPAVVAVLPPAPGRDHEKAAGVTAAELMTSPPVTVGPDEPLAEAARIMRDRRLKRLPVISATGHLIGILSRGDVLGVFTRPDADIRREAAEEVIAETFLMDSRRFTVTVHDGIVTLTGRPETDQAARELVEAVRQIDGVIAVRDQLSYAGKPR